MGLHEKSAYKIQVIKENPNLTCMQIAKKLNCSQSAVWLLAKNYDLPTASFKKRFTRTSHRKKPDEIKEGMFDYTKMAY